MELTCIVCPIGCTLNIIEENSNIVDIKGARCKRGISYANEEFICPKRTLTTAIKAPNGSMLPVKSDKPLPKDRLFDFMKEINKVSVRLPIHIGDLIIKNIYNNVNIVATRNIK